MVAESTEILAPMLQLGWATAWLRRDARHLGAASGGGTGRPRRSGSAARCCSWRSPRSAWKIALCSESTGSSTAPLRAHLGSISSAPAQTRHSLVASATMAPRRTAASVGSRPAAPTIAAITQSAGRAAASTRPSRPAGDLDTGAGERVLERRRSRRIADHREPGAMPPRGRGQARRRCAGRSAPRPGSARARSRSDRACSARPSRWRRGW